jgi:hypothetical protein
MPCVWRMEVANHTGADFDAVEPAGLGEITFRALAAETVDVVDGLMPVVPLAQPLQPGIFLQSMAFSLCQIERIVTYYKEPSSDARGRSRRPCVRRGLGSNALTAGGSTSLSAGKLWMVGTPVEIALNSRGMRSDQPG